MDQRHKTRGGKLRLATVANGNLGGALHIDTTVIRRERVRRQIGDQATRLYASDLGAPAVLLESLIDVGRHRVG